MAMPKYTTGELAKLCGVSVRTVQYYDARSILMPSELSEGGRRLYSEEDLRRMKIICFLRELGLPIDSIKQLLSEKHPEAVIHALLSQQEQLLQSEIGEQQEQLRLIRELQAELRGIRDFTVDSIGGIAQIMENKKQTRKTHTVMLAIGFVMDALQIATLMLWILRGIWIPFAVAMLGVVGMGIWITRFYWHRTAYLCPSCHTVFKPTLRQTFFAPHTPKTRKLTCTHCHYNGFCVETYHCIKGE